MASVFDMNHPFTWSGWSAWYSWSLLPQISLALIRTPGWSAPKSVLLWTADLTLAILLLIMAALIVLIAGHTRAGNKGVPNVVGYPNRLLVVLYCVWAMTVAAYAIKPRNQR